MVCLFETKEIAIEQRRIGPSKTLHGRAIVIARRQIGLGVTAVRSIVVEGPLTHSGPTGIEEKSGSLTR